MQPADPADAHLASSEIYWVLNEGLKERGSNDLKDMTFFRRCLVRYRLGANDTAQRRDKTTHILAPFVIRMHASGVMKALRDVLSVFAWLIAHGASPNHQ